MSLTSFLKNDAELRAILDANFEKPPFELDHPRRAEPHTTNYALIGTAFDYLLRFWLEQHYDTPSKPWVAEQAVLLAEFSVDNLEPFERALVNAEAHHQTYLETGALTDELLAATLDLARLDGIYRSGRIPTDLGEAAPGDIIDLRTLYECIPVDVFSDVSTVSLNPSFGAASHLVGGADGDLILDGALIDIKTVKALTLKAEYWRQLVGYALLIDIARDVGVDVQEVTELGVYFSRHGVLWSVPATHVYDQDLYPDIKAWFQQRASERFGSN